MTAYTPKTGARCSCRRGVERDNCPNCEGTGWVIDFRAIHERRRKLEAAKSTESRGHPMKSQGMSDAKQTLEPLVVQRWENRIMIARFDAGRVCDWICTDVVDEETAARIVACVNACAGLAPQMIRGLLDAVNEVIANTENRQNEPFVGYVRRTLTDALSAVRGEEE